jgi:hypothetical protein
LPEPPALQIHVQGAQRLAFAVAVLANQGRAHRIGELVAGVGRRGASLLVRHPHRMALGEHQLGKALVERHPVRGASGNHQLRPQLVLVVDPQKADDRRLGPLFEQLERNPDDVIRIVAAQQADRQLVQQH